MRKVVITCSFVGFILLVVLAGRAAFAGTAADLSRADGFYKVAQYAEAEQVYKAVIREADLGKSSESDAASAAVKGLVLAYIATDQLSLAEAAIQPLLANPTPHALHEIVEEADTLKKLSEVYQMYQDLIVAKANDPQVIWLKTGLAITSVHIGDDSGVQAMQQEIIAKHGSDDRAAEALGQIAWAYRKLGKYDKALPINQYAVDNWPQKDRAAYSQQGIVACQIALGNIAAADQAVDVLIQKFGKDADASKLVLWSGFAYQDATQKEGAYRTYGQVVQNYPQTPEAVVAQLRRALADVEAEDPNRMGQDIQALITQFTVTEDKGTSLSNVADSLYWKHVDYVGKVDKQSILPSIDSSLQTIAKYILATWPQSDWALSSARNVAVVAAQAGEDSDAEAVVQKMVTDYPTNPKLTEAVFQIGEQYWKMAGVERGKSLGLAKGQKVVILKKIPDMPEKAKAGYASAKRIWKRIAENLPTSDTTPQAVFFVAECCRALDQNQEAMAGYQKVVDQWPGYEYAWMAQDRIIKGYREMAALGSMSVYDSETAITAAYERMLKLFPNCPAASIAREWLKSRHEKSESQLRKEMAQRQQMMNQIRIRASIGGSK
jgi:TolA-binding protein